MSIQSQKLPTISIVMPCYNVESFVQKAIKSVFAQRYDGNIQFVIVDDGSTDGTWEKIQEIIAREGQEKNVVVVRHNKNMGVSAATDTAYSHATGEWIVKADSDDIQLPDRCAAYAEIAQRHPNACAIILSFQRMTEDEVLLEKVPYCATAYDKAEYECTLSTPEERFHSRTEQSNIVRFYDLGLTTAIKRELYLKWGGLTENGADRVRFSDDIVWGARYMMSGEVVGAKRLSCLCRNRASGNLEYRMQGVNYHSMRQMELCTESSMCAKAEAYRQAAKCCEQGMLINDLSDWTSKMLQQYQDRLNNFSRYFYARSQWWKWSWFKRCYWILKHGANLHPAHRKWCYLRLAPLWLICIGKTCIYRLR